MSLLFHLRVAGILQILLALFHLLLPSRLNWREDLNRLSLVNRQIFWVHTFFIGLVLALQGALSLFWAPALVEPSRLGPPLLGALTLFWGLRLLFQWFVFDRALWRGQSFNTVVHLSFTLLWVYFTAVYGWGFWTAAFATR